MRKAQPFQLELHLACHILRPVVLRPHRRSRLLCFLRPMSLRTTSLAKLQLECHTRRLHCQRRCLHMWAQHCSTKAVAVVMPVEVAAAIRRFVDGAAGAA